MSVNLVNGIGKNPYANYGKANVNIKEKESSLWKSKNRLSKRFFYTGGTDGKDNLWGESE